MVTALVPVETVTKRLRAPQARQEDHMRLALIGLATIAAALAADVQAVSAQNESFFQERYCTRSMGGFRFGGNLDCSYRTWQQCIESARGLGRYCLQNPWWHGPRGQPSTQGKSRRRNRQ